MLVDHRWNCWLNTGKTMFSQQRTKIHDFIVDVPWFSYVFPMNSAIWPGIFEPFATATLRVSPAGRSTAWASAKTPASSRHWDFVQPAPGDQSPTDFFWKTTKMPFRNLKIKVRRERYRRVASSKLRLDLRNVAWNVAWNVVCLRCTGMGSASNDFQKDGGLGGSGAVGATTEKINRHMF